MKVNITLTPELITILPEEVLRSILLDIVTDNSSADTITQTTNKIENKPVSVENKPIVENKSIASNSAINAISTEENNLIDIPVKNNNFKKVQVLTDELIKEIGARYDQGEGLAEILKDKKYENYHYTSVYTRLLRAGHAKQGHAKGVKKKL